MKSELTRKGESRCFVFYEDDVDVVTKTIYEIDEYEYGYMPLDWVAFWDYDNNPSHPNLVYNGKFDINVVKLKIACAKKGVAISIVSTNFDNSECY